MLPSLTYSFWPYPHLPFGPWLDFTSHDFPVDLPINLHDDGGMVQPLFPKLISHNFPARWSDKVPLPSSALRLLRNLTLRLQGRDEAEAAPVVQLHVAKTAGTMRGENPWGWVSPVVN